MSGNKRPPGKDFDLPSIQPKQLRVDSPFSQQGAGQQFVLPTRPDTSRRFSQGQARLIGIHGILPNVTRQPPPSTFAFPSPASSLSPLSLHVRSPLSAGGLVGISPNPVTGVPHLRSPHLPITNFPIGTTTHSQNPPTGVVALEASYLPPDHTPGTGPLALIRPGSPVSVALGIPPRPLQSANPLAPPPPYPLGHLAGVGGGSTPEEYTCASPSQFLRSPTSVTAISSQLPSSSSSSASADDTTRPTAIPGDSLKKESLPPVAAPPPSLITTPPHPRKRDQLSVKTRLLKQRRSRLAAMKLRYEVQLKEMYFLDGGGNLMDFIPWKRKPNILREQYLKQYDIDVEGTPTGHLSPKDTLSLSSSLKVPGGGTKLDPEHPLPDHAPSTISHMAESTKHGHKSSKVAGAGSRSSKQDTFSSTRIQIPLSTVSPSLQVVSPLPVPTASTPKSATTPSSPMKTLQIPSLSPRPATRAQLQTQVSFSSVYESTHEDIVLRARHEAEVMRAIADLRKEGLWSSSRLPKVQEPNRRRALWDFLLEEMQWLATDFANERRWKINAAKKVWKSCLLQWCSVYQIEFGGGGTETMRPSFLRGQILSFSHVPWPTPEMLTKACFVLSQLSRSMMRHHVEQSTMAQRSEKEEHQRLRKIASSIAKEIKHFWESVRKVQCTCSCILGFQVSSIST